MQRADQAMEERALRQLIGTGFLTPTVLEFNRWVLRSLPEESILITNGDWDTYPALALQVVDGLRRDVAIVNRSLLNLSWYAGLIAERQRVDLPMTSTEMELFRPFREADGDMVTVSDATIRGWMESGDVSGRPLVFAATVEMSAFQDFAQLLFTGPHWRMSQDADMPDIDLELVRLAMEDASGSDFSSPEVSPQDRSAIRKQAASNRGLARVVLHAGYRFFEAMIESGDVEAAWKAVEWAEQFASDAGLEGDHRQIVERMKQAVEDAAR
jgi:hypothetical protein